MIVKGSPPAWLESTSEALCELLTLAPNWDSYGAKAIRVESVMAAIDLLRAIMHDASPAPAVVPTPRGFVQLEWHCGGRDLEIEVRSLGDYVASFENANSGECWEQGIGWDWSPLVRVVAELSTSK